MWDQRLHSVARGQMMHDCIAHTPSGAVATRGPRRGRHQPNLISSLTAGLLADHRMRTIHYVARYQARSRFGRKRAVSKRGLVGDTLARTNPPRRRHPKLLGATRTHRSYFGGVPTASAPQSLTFSSPGRR
jgi:hypothetical protein